MEKVSDYIFRYLAEHTGVRHVFMLPGGGCMHLVDSLGKQPGLEFVCNLHEQACAIAAEAYAQNNNELGIALVTTGPGSTNAITGVAGAWIDSTPLLVLSGQAKREDRMTGLGVRQMGIQEVDITAIVAPIIKYAKCVTEPESIRLELEKALYLAQHGRRGPVWLDIPLDVQGAQIDPDRLTGFTPEPAAEPDYKTAAVTILEELRQAHRPAVYAGNGIRAAGAVDDFLKLVERLQIPVLTSWKAADFLPEDHPLFVGRPGIIAQRGANFVQQTADCLLILGTRLDLCQTGFNHPHFAPNARKLMVDIDIHEIDKLNMPFAGKFAMDAGEVIRAMLAERPDALPCAAFLNRAKEWQKRYPVILPEYCDESKKLVNLYHLVEVLSHQLEPGDILIPGSSGACAEVTMQAVKVKSGVRIHNTPGLGSMGFGLPATLGGCLASGRKRTVGIVGDGGLQHNIQELETLHRLNLPVKLFVLNNNGYGSIYNMQNGRFAGHLVACNPASGLTLPDLERIAKAYQLDFVRIASPKELDSQVRAVLERPGAVICEVMTDPSVPSAPRLASEALPDGRMVSKPMEDLAPFLSREELAENLSIV
ncbi:thiamine pyrophosphate-binding protein [uncultured Victivallis sp.]|uniref:thiamine pyrophosphate-binding protein n=1 Tax=uncultured Victivallis sp. TaxID=354118 RepID=UPI0025FACFBE|nr:thiamine pyrophosphate-binding protein [uncultured Victivallis sp.]